MFEVGQWATPVWVSPRRVNLLSGGMDHVRVPDIVADPAEVFGQLDRRAAEGLLAVGVLVARLGQVGVRVDVACCAPARGSRA